MLERMDIPTRPEEITAVWLTQALQSTGMLGEETAVSSLTIEPLSGAGYLGQTVRLRPVYNPPTANLPPTLIAKMSHPDPNVRQGVFWAYEREDFFYQILASQVSLTTPTCYFTVYNPQTFQSILLLQDLAHLRMFDLTRGCGLAEAQTVVTHLARHHAQWWQDPRLIEMEAYIKPVNERWAESDEVQLELIRMSWSRYTEVMPTLLYNSYLPVSFLAMGERVFNQFFHLLDQLAASPSTLRHGDTHLDNLLFAVAENDPPLTTLDWQLYRRGPGVCDISYFLIWSAPVSLRRQAEGDLLQTYHATLVESGVTDYSFEQCWRDYRLSFFTTLDTFVGAISTIDFTRPHGRALVDATTPRLASFAEDHRVTEFLV